MNNLERPKAGGAYVRDAKSGVLKKAGNDQSTKKRLISAIQKDILGLPEGAPETSNKVPSTKAKPASNEKSDANKGK